VTTTPARLPLTPARAFLAALIGVALFVLGIFTLPPAGAILLGGLLCLGGVVIFSNMRLRLVSLTLASVLIAFAAAEAFIGVLATPPVNRDVVKDSTPYRWTDSDSVLGYRPRPNTTINVVATYGKELVFKQTYHIEPTGERRTPGSSADGPTYLFVGDSYVFGEGLSDDQTLPARFAAGLRPPAHVVNLGVLGYSPAHVLRAIETGSYDKYVHGKVAAVVTWITRIHLPRLSGDGGWLGSSPRYELDAAGHVRYTGSFNEHRLYHPTVGIEYLARTYLASAKRAVGDRIEHEQVPLYFALLAKLRDQVRERYNAPLILIYDWPENEAYGEQDTYYLPYMKDLRALGVPMVSVRKITGPYSEWPNFYIPHDFHPNARLAAGLAKELLTVVGQ
jgi:hypothetical protein